MNILTGHSLKGKRLPKIVLLITGSLVTCLEDIIKLNNYQGFLQNKQHSVSVGDGQMLSLCVSKMCAVFQGQNICTVG